MTERQTVTEQRTIVQRVHEYGCLVYPLAIGAAIVTGIAINERFFNNDNTEEVERRLSAIENQSNTTHELIANMSTRVAEVDYQSIADRAVAQATAASTRTPLRVSGRNSIINVGTGTEDFTVDVNCVVSGDIQADDDENWHDNDNASALITIFDEAGTFDAVYGASGECKSSPQKAQDFAEQLATAKKAEGFETIDIIHWPSGNPQG